MVLSVQELKSRLGEYAKDTKLNLGSVLSEEGAPDLKRNQIYGIALASAYATQCPEVVQAVQQDAAVALSEAEIHAAKAAATIMAMNNVYYRFNHLVSDKEYSKMPARLRMNVIGSPGIDRADFEMMSLAVSAINGCGMCMDAHVHEVTKAGISRQGVQSCIRIAAVIAAAAQGCVIGGME
ncbi:MAG: carboxymuconolactone decarboxylase family protein [Alphaproteobacteria bacterium]|nr:carboxymuconolactone decarboxylase family protein [Alphaproteobacteria bacterium]